jgi:hypothetical protein
MKIVITESQYKFLKEQTTPIKPIEPSLLEKLVTNFLLPVSGGPLGVITKDVYKKYVDGGRKIYNDFASIVNRRLDYNKKNNLPLEKMTPEEINYRNRIYKATPDFGYPDVLRFMEIVGDIQSGKDIRKSERDVIKGKYVPDEMQGKMNPEKVDSRYNSRDELKKMWLGIDNPNGLQTGEWIQSKYKPTTSKDPNAIYYMPKTLPNLTQKEFDLVYNEILKTKKPDGTFPGGNSDIVFPKLPKNLAIKFENQLGHFKFGAAEENGKKYISLYDEWDLVPPTLKNMGIDIQKFGKIPLIYYRIYRP